eukprot:CAMPEP_0182903680 /NCGR_PEP_ID=MMETSP0034_2-20130328/31498_1 /TAXON_ID=156128 /ORGANISM="Nephroselmis pyriformis, Strain CCMP717" /LENGTH=114 /DNA_ID=CAMNT_0025038627 /DNA_START=18 /DNA_END=359 /DNA_ORIENTATION=+
MTCPQMHTPSPGAEARGSGVQAVYARGAARRTPVRDEIGETGSAWHMSPMLLDSSPQSAARPRKHAPSARAAQRLHACVDISASTSACVCGGRAYLDLVPEHGHLLLLLDRELL